MRKLIAILIARFNVLTMTLRSFKCTKVNWYWIDQYNVGMCSLDLSNHFMHDFYCHKSKPQYWNSIYLCIFTLKQTDMVWKHLSILDIRYIDNIWANCHCVLMTHKKNIFLLTEFKHFRKGTPVRKLVYRLAWFRLLTCEVLQII